MSSALSTILIVEDDAAARDVIVAAATEAQLAVEVAPTSLAALERLRAGEAPALLVLNIDMPAAWDVWDEHQAITKLRQVPVIVVSRLVRAGIGDAIVLAKPLDREELIRALRDPRAR